MTIVINNPGTGPTLYKTDSVGRLRTWAMELDGSRYRTMAGLMDGKQAVSGWTQATAASQCNDEDQALFEVRAKYTHQLDREYRRSVAELADVKDEFTEPMLAKTYTDFPGPGFSQPKLDGIRCIAKAEGLFSRQGQPIIAVPHIHAAMAPLFETDPDLILDGELYNHDLRDDFGAISSIVRKKNPTAEQLEKAEAVMQYHVYDIIDTEQTFGERSKRLGDLLTKLDCAWIVDVPTQYTPTKDDAMIFYGNFVEAGYEGGMFRLDALYELGRRSKSLLKRKEFITEEFQVLKLLEGKGNWAGAVKTVVLRNKPEYSEVDNGYGKGNFGAGIRGSYDTLAAMLDDDVGPLATATVRYFMLSPDGVPRFPVVIDYHPNGRKD